MHLKGNKQRSLYIKNYNTSNENKELNNQLITSLS